MNVNGVTSATAAYAYAQQKPAVKESKPVESTKPAESSGVIYEPSEEAKAASAAKTYTPDTSMIEKLKMDADARTEQLRSLVEQLISKQATTSGNATDIWSFLREGKFTVDPATKAQAQADIAEDGYWGVNQTSDRIIAFANALTGGDPSKIEEMREAFKKGFESAQKTWGGALPEISQKTYDAVMQKFDALKEASEV